MKRLTTILLSGLLLIGCDKKPTPEQIKENQDRLQQTVAQVDRLARAASEGATVAEIDVWGSPIQHTTEQHWASEIITIRSAGPDVSFDTQDDVVKKIKQSNPSGLLEGIPGWAWFVAIWGVCALLAIGFRTNRRHRRRAQGVGIGDLAVVAFAPLALLGLAVPAIIPNFEFDPFDIDLPDFDLDIDL